MSRRKEPWAAFPLDAKVVFPSKVERFPHFTIAAGTKGIVVESSTDGVWVLIDKHVHGLSEAEDCTFAEFCWSADDWHADPAAPFETSMNDRLFIGVFPTGISYADRGRDKDGDYAKVAFLPFGTLIFEVEDATSPLLEAARQHAATIEARRGEAYKVSACGQTVRLGKA